MVWVAMMGGAWWAVGWTIALRAGATVEVVWAEDAVGVVSSAAVVVVAVGAIADGSCG